MQKDLKLDKELLTVVNGEIKDAWSLPYIFRYDLARSRGLILCNGRESVGAICILGNYVWVLAVSKVVAYLSYHGGRS